MTQKQKKSRVKVPDKSEEKNKGGDASDFEREADALLERTKKTREEAKKKLKKYVQRPGE